jgi:hypothetical protein
MTEPEQSYHVAQSNDHLSAGFVVSANPATKRFMGEFPSDKNDTNDAPKVL